MARRKNGFRMYIALLVLLLIGAVALFVYASMSNSNVPTPHRPGGPRIAEAFPC